jgi:hypothetical protein
MASDNKILSSWEAHYRSIVESASVDLSETIAARQKRMQRLEANPEEWIKYYFPRFANAESAPFHIKATNRIINNPEWYEVRSWSRELAKSVRTMFETLYLVLVGHPAENHGTPVTNVPNVPTRLKKKYLLLISNNESNAIKLLAPYRVNLESNKRLIADYGVQETPGKWGDGEFTTLNGAGFKALGAGQSPRGTRNEEIRPDIIVFDDIDTDEDCRNTEIIIKRWKWIEEAAMGTRSVSKKTTVIFCGNIIAKDCCVVRAQALADNVDIVNIRDIYGKSSWPAKNTEEMIDRVLSKLSYNAQQKEYFNNPIEEGTVFKELTWGVCPPLKKLKFAVIYADPSTSNKDKPSGRTATNSCKAVVVLGYHNLKYYVYNAWLDITTNAKFVNWLYAAHAQVVAATQPYSYIENNGLQNPFYEQVILPLIYQLAPDHGGQPLPITPDTRDKPDKFFRIEGNLEPLNRMGNLILNIAEKDNPHMLRLESQFKSVSPTSKTMDGPDAVEGGVHKVKEKIAVESVGGIEAFDKKPNNKRW